MPPYNVDGCSSNPAAAVAGGGGGDFDRFNLVAELSILNKGLGDFIPHTSFVGTADCQKVAIFGFYKLTFPGGPYIRHATCLIDDSSYTKAKQDGVSTCTQDLIKAGIKQGGGYGVQRTVKVKFPMTTKQYIALNSTSPDTTITVRLSVNHFLSEGSPHELFINLGNKLANIEWKRDEIYHPAVNIYNARTAPTATPIIIPHPTVAPTVAPTSINTVLINYPSSTTSRHLNLAEVVLFNNNVQLESSLLTFTFSSTYDSTLYPASKCNNGVVNEASDMCISNSETNPSLTIVSPTVFNKVVVYNTLGGGQDRIGGASITATINGVLAATQSFPPTTTAADLVFTFTF